MGRAPNQPLFESLEPRRLLAAVPAAQPDLQIKLRTESAYIGDNIHLSTAAPAQSRAAPGGFYPTVYHLRVQNDGPTADSVTLTGTGGRRGRWRVRYYDSPVTGFSGGINITDAVAGRGWDTGPIAPGAAKDLRLEVLPLLASVGGDSRTVSVTATSHNDSTRSDVVTATTTDTPARAVAIRRRNFDDSGVYLATVQNLGNVADRVRVTGPAGGRRFTVRYFDAPVGGRDVTDAVTGKGWLSKRKLQPGAELPLRVEIRARRGLRRTITLRAASASDPSARDSADITNRASGVAGPGFFPIGVWSQPKSSFDKWKARGINTMVQYEGAAATIDEWTQAAVDRGLYMIRRPRPNPAGDVGQRNLIAWAHPDEPDIVSTHHPAPFIAAEYARWKAVDPDMPVWVNFSGGYVNHWQGDRGRGDYQAFLDATDWVSSSIYPVNGWDRPGDLDGPGKAVDRLEQWSGGKPQFAVIEAADQQLYWMPKGVPGPTPGQFRAEIWDAVVRGARGIIYFPQSFKPGFSYDNAAPDLVAEMQVQNARVTTLGDVLLSPSDPPTLGIDAAAPLEATWRFHKGRAYFVVLNRSDRTLAAQALRLQGTGRSKSAAVDGERRTVGIVRGVIHDDFAPFETHVYVVG